MKPFPEELEEALARMILRERIGSLVQELTRLKRGPDEKSIHDTRVQSRRMRAALEAFKDLFPPYPWNAVYSRIRQVTKALGKARETEVSLSLLKEQTGSGDMAENLCREYLEQRFQKTLQKRKRKLKKSLREINLRELRSKTQFLLSNLGPFEDLEGSLTKGGGRPSAKGGNVPQLSLFRLQEEPTGRGRRVLEELSAPILSFRARYDFRRATDQQLHDLRIAAKKLRYGLEIFSPAFPSGLDKEIALARALQDAGGHYHDWCVLRETLQKEIRRLTKQETTHLAFQLGRLLSQAQDQRAELRKKILPALTQLQAALRAILRTDDLLPVPVRADSTQKVEG
jgi:CHAD domain-containing protein